ncbi:PBP1 and LysM peptidoglycan-binding domain-containing protein [Brumimicrobium mesophilum]|uniref:PBP1 and LysM peptidoglycan-binding domain-containing protein n=1 Tax=Brumimicrobium mesophilum TaxID=392717 RepID=UPI00131BF323|nr:LysM peptidoglycan-binding domain-containing protein [Brumimicrobium mesophilum]
MRILIVLVIFLSASFAALSQEIGQETRDGKLFKVHAVEAGNTLYGLHIKYDVTIESIIKFNPTAKEGLQVGQILYIPTDGSSAKTETQDKFRIHTVKRKETLYGISREYGVTVAEIIRLNPGSDQGLDIKQELKIPFPSKEEEKPLIAEDKIKETKEEKTSEEKTKPKDFEPHNPFKKDSVTVIDYKVDFKDSIVNYKVQQGETLYSISRRFMVPVEQLVEQNNLSGSSISPGQILTIKLKQERIEEVEVRELVNLNTIKKSNVHLVKKKNKYKVLVALPMKLGSNSQAISGMFTETTSLNTLTNLSVEFLMGAQLALDSLEKLGLNADVEFFDTYGDLDKLKEKLDSRNANDIDVVIGPFYPQLLDYAAQWGMNNKVPIVAVTKIPTKVLENNPYVLSMVPSELTMISAMARYLAKNHVNDNIVIIDGENTEVRERVQYFKDAFEKSQPLVGRKSLKSSGMGDASGRTLVNLIQTDGNNFIICLSNDVQQVMKFVNTLNAAKNYSGSYGRASVTMVGLNNWLEIPALNSYYRNRFEFHFPAANYLNYDSPEVKEFTREYRLKYKSDPSKYAFHGFDVMLSQGSSLLLGYSRDNGLMDSFDVQSLGGNHGSENSSVFISKQSDFEIILLEIISNTNKFDVKQRGGN